MRLGTASGRITSPWFGQEAPAFYSSKDHHNHYILEFPENMRSLIGTLGTLRINLTVSGRENTCFTVHLEIH